jgi:hypothetical protein
VLGEQLGQFRFRVGDGRLACAAVGWPVQGDRRRSEQPADVRHQSGITGTPPVDLVDEQDRRHGKTLECPHEHTGMRLHTLHSGQDENRTVEHAERTLDFGDEVGVTGCVDQVHFAAGRGEGGDRGTNGDAAAAFQIHTVGLGTAVVD